MVEETNGAVYLAVNRTLLQSVHWPVNGVVNGVVNRGVYNAANRTVNWVVSNAAYRAVSWAVYWAVHGVRQSNSMHPALQEFLYSCGTEMEV